MRSPAQTETARRNTPSRAPEMPLQGCLLILARTGWVMVALLTIICYFLSIPVEFTRLQTVCMSGARGHPGRKERRHER
ncbi:MAG TPA: hypothetical protein VEL31_06455 [Ktedonobacteraceae bacterium]|nr:hypothetical protein [Ktedonobacteraceae bacterium]